MDNLIIRPATDADLAAGNAVVDAVNAALISDCGYAADDTALLLPVTLGDEIVERGGVTWYGVSDATSMPWFGWVAASSTSTSGTQISDADVSDPEESPLNF